MEKFIALDKVLDEVLKELGKKSLISLAGDVILRQSVGLDVGDKWTVLCFVEILGGDVVKRDRVRSTPEAMMEYFGDLEAMRLVLEVGPHSPWMSRTLAGCGHEVLVVDPSSIVGKKKKKTDKIDAEQLARLGRDPRKVTLVRHRSPEAQADLAVLRSRDAVVSQRTGLICHARGTVKAWGSRLSSADSAAFSKKVRDEIPKELEPALVPILELISELTQRIRTYDRQIEQFCKEKYPETYLMRQIGGVGPITSLTLRLVLDDPARFRKSRQVGPYAGLVPGLDQSGETDKPLGITKEGDAYLRKVLVNSANYILGPFGKDCDLRRHGERIAAGGGKIAKRRAKVAVARKLAVLMHRLWVSAEAYDPLYASKKQERRTRRRLVAQTQLQQAQELRALESTSIATLV